MSEMDRYSKELQYTHSTGYTITGEGPTTAETEIVEQTDSGEDSKRPVGRSPPEIRAPLPTRNSNKVTRVQVRNWWGFPIYKVRLKGIRSRSSSANRTPFYSSTSSAHHRRTKYSRDLARCNSNNPFHSDRRTQVKWRVDAAR